MVASGKTTRVIDVLLVGGPTDKLNRRKGQSRERKTYWGVTIHQKENKRKSMPPGGS